jgi:acetylornithine aminotransferase/acetylornithine/N-succinyldiaminopimelate aminotransferase
LQGLVVDGDAGEVVARARAGGLLVSVAGGNVVRFVPPLVVSKAEIDEALSILEAAL